MSRPRDSEHALPAPAPAPPSLLPHSSTYSSCYFIDVSQQFLSPIAHEIYTLHIAHTHDNY